MGSGLSDAMKFVLEIARAEMDHSGEDWLVIGELVADAFGRIDPFRTSSHLNSVPLTDPES
jgi:hypothetical protein